MTRNDDAQLLRRFTRRLAGIEADVKDPPTRDFGTVGASIRWVGSGATVVGLFVVVAVAIGGFVLLGGRLPAISAPAVGGQTDTPTIQPSQDEAKLIVLLVRHGAPIPSGVGIAPIADSSIFLARLTNETGDEVASWQVGDAKSPDVLVSPGGYLLAVWRIWVSDSAETGARTTSEPLDGCSSRVLLPAGTTTTLTVHATSGHSCLIDPPIRTP